MTAGTVSVQFNYYQNPGGTDTSGDDCDVIGTCDTYFEISAIDCGSGCSVGSKKTTKVYENDNYISWSVGEDLGPFTNPLSYSFTKWKVSMYDIQVTSFCQQIANKPIHFL